MKNLYFANTRLDGGFWGHYDELVRKVTIKAVYERLKETGRFDALRCDWKEGKPNQPHVYWDSDVAKWIEAVAYLTETKKEPELEQIVDRAAEYIENNQKPSGYFNSYYLTVEPGVEFQNRNNHELYCAGHLIEAAIAYDRATGKGKLLSCMRKYADYIYQVFYLEHSAAFVTPGHQEIEHALLKLAEYTGEGKYLELARYFIMQRGIGSDADISNAEYGPKSDQSDRPVMETDEALGHAVRACYLYTAMAELAVKTNNSALLDVCKKLFRNITEKKLSITGGIGSCSLSEAFDKEYELSNLNSYNETCAAIALSMFAGELQQAEANAAYGDLIERIWFNGFLSGISLTGDAFFYENALEIDVRKYSHLYLDQPAMDTIETRSRNLLSSQRLQRAKSFDCFCCPPNISRMLATIPRYMYTVDEDVIYCNQFAQSQTTLTVKGQPATIRQVTSYPSDGKLSFTYHGAPVKLAVRIPQWCIEYTGPRENGFAFFSVTDGDTVTLELPMQVHFVEANPNVRDCAGRYAVMRGPIVYCMEELDNGKNLPDVALLENGVLSVVNSEEYHAPVLFMQARRRPVSSTLYQVKQTRYEEFTAKLIPYFGFANRGVTDMLIWTMVK